MADGGLPPPPINDTPGSFTWLEWYRQLRSYISTNGSVPWYVINFAGSKLTDIADRPHDATQGIQGGTAGEHYHLKENERNTIADGRITLAAGTTTVPPLKLTTQPAGLTSVVQGVFELIGNSLQFTSLAKRRGVVQSQSVLTSGVVVTNTLTETSLFTTQYGANYLEVGKSEEIVLRGIIGKVNANTLTLRLKYAGTTILTLSFAGLAITAGTACEILVANTCRSIGASGTMQINLFVRIDGVNNPPDSRSLVTINTTSAQTLELTAQWGTASASNTLTIDQGRVLCIDGAK